MAEGSAPFRWPGDASLALSVVVNVEEGAEASPVDGDSRPEAVDELGFALREPVRNLANESNYRYGIEAAAPRVLALLDDLGVDATVTASALALERAPELAERLADSRHEVAAHGFRWAFQHRMDETQEREFISRATESIERTVGRRPVGWLSRYLTTERTRQLLAEHDYIYTMDDYSADLPYWDRSTRPALLVVPYALDTNDIKFWNAPSLSTEQWLSYARNTLEWLVEEGRSEARLMSLGVHLRIIGRPGRIGALKAFLEYASGRPGVWIATREAIAEHYAEAQPAPSG